MSLPHPFALDLAEAGPGVDLAPIVGADRARVAPPGLSVLLRAGLAFLAFAAIGAVAVPAMAEPAAPPAEAAPAPRLRGDVTARGDVLTLADLVENVPPALAARPMFRAPALGSSGTIQARRISEAAAAAGLTGIETGGRLQIAVQRAARRAGPAEIEEAFRRWLQANYNLDPRSVSVRLDGESPSLLAPVDLAGALDAVDTVYDPRSHRIAGLVVLGDRQASLRVSGIVVETREVAVLARALNRGETVRQGDLTMERRPRETLSSDAQASAAAVLGEVAQRALPAGLVLRAADTALPELVARGDTVTIVYEAPGVSLQMRGTANEGGRMGATVNVVNAASKKVLQATVAGPGRVSVGPGPAPGPQLQASATPR